MWTVGLEQSPAYFSRRVHSASRTPSRVDSHHRTQSMSQPRSIISMDSHRSRERGRSRERSTSPFEGGIQRVPPRRKDFGPASNDGGRSRYPSSPRRYPDPIWKRQMTTMPVEHSKFMWDIVSYISNVQAFFDFAIGCGIPSHIV